MTTGESEGKPPERFNYERFSEAARAVVVTASHLALSAGHRTVLPSDLAAAAAGVEPIDRRANRQGVTEFAPSTIVILHRAFADAVKSDRRVELHDLVDAHQ